MGSQLQRALRSLCLDTGWKYAVFWKLKHRARMMLTCRDAYYDNDNPEKTCLSNFVDNLHDGHSSHDPLGLAVAKMSYHVYSLGEGVVGQVAVTGKHLWISADKFMTDPGFPFEYCDGLQTQFSAGIKTIAVVAVVPHGVVQLGSLDQIAEDLKMVNHIRDVFSELQESLATSTESSCLSDVTTRTSGSGVYHDCLQNVDGRIDKGGVDFCSIYSSAEKPVRYSYNYSIPGSYQNQMVQMINKHEGAANSVQGCGKSDNFRLPTSRRDVVEQQKHEPSIGVGDSEGQHSGSKSLGKCMENGSVSLSEKVCSKSGAYVAALPAVNSAMHMPPLPSEVHDSTPSNGGTELSSVPGLPDMLLCKDPTNVLHMPFRFCAGYELYEALGPAFQKQNTNYEWGTETTETGMAIEMSEEMPASSLITANSGTGTEHLLEAVVANISNEVDNIDKSFLKSEFLSNSEKMSEPCTSDVGSIGSAGYSFDRETFNSLNSSGAYGVPYSKAFSSTSCSRGSETMEKPQESNKIHKKRARPGESCRPRPRDRQLIQDRIKELRELVPNGSKCSIDSLLERTIKHMIFMQSITKHAEKLNKCTGSKLLDQEACVRGPSRAEQGSSWAVEVGSTAKVCPIVVENINMNGQMLIEMLCEECSHFLEIAEAIRSMGLTILKGVTESYGEKTWMRFVVEGQNNRSLHRMDVLWSLMQLLQPKINV